MGQRAKDGEETWHASEVSQIQAPSPYTPRRPLGYIHFNFAARIMEEKMEEEEEVERCWKEASLPGSSSHFMLSLAFKKRR